ncbi:hypothetical protein CC78DRAFT_93880 [Lojkania enalia]|uniref:Uncharacterized protein n=1 Tax=Lojkania enalia TaxID=147567 RepID=A0A9P4KIJ5_9PLEO|nr:hypothetical protein CC78DRAFT_93880 [Didymosphaeria enalia]
MRSQVIWQLSRNEVGSRYGSVLLPRQRRAESSRARSPRRCPASTSIQGIPTRCFWNAPQSIGIQIVFIFIFFIEKKKKKKRKERKKMSTGARALDDGHKERRISCRVSHRRSWSYYTHATTSMHGMHCQRLRS